MNPTTLPEALSSIPAAYNIADAKIEEMRREFLPLKIESPDDTKGAKRVHDARMAVKNTRVAIEKKRKELKADALAYGNAVDAEAKRITAQIEPIEEHLQREEDEFEAEKRRRVERAAEEKRIKLRARMDALGAVRSPAMPFDVEQMDDAAFNAELARATAENEERKRAEQAELDRLAAQKAEQDRIALELAAERERIEAERRASEEAQAKARAEQEAKNAAERERIAAEGRAAAEARAKADAEAAARIAEQERAIDAERAKIRAEHERAEAERRAVENERARVAAEEAAKLEREKLAAEEAARREAAKPVAFKVRGLASTLKGVPIPNVPQAAELRAILRSAVEQVEIIADKIEGGAA
jgi:hypothetical protein